MCSSKFLVMKKLFHPHIKKPSVKEMLKVLGSYSRQRIFHASRISYLMLSTKRTLVLKDKSRPMRIDRELPDPTKDKVKRRIQLGAFFVAMGVSLACIFNYEKTQSPIISNTLYHLRRSALTRDLLGDSIDFDGLVPWVYGELNQVSGDINIRFAIKGSKGVRGMVKLVADRENKNQEFLIHEWSVTVNGKKIDLLSEEGEPKTL